MSNFTGKFAVVTGAAKGIGAGAVKRYLDDGIEAVALVDMNLDAAEATARELDPTGKKVIALKCNVADSDMVKAAVDKTLETFGRIDVLINNAGVTRDRIFHKMTDEE